VIENIERHITTIICRLREAASEADGRVTPPSSRPPCARAGSAVAFFSRTTGRLDQQFRVRSPSRWRSPLQRADAHARLAGVLLSRVEKRRIFFTRQPRDQRRDIAM